MPYKNLIIVNSNAVNQQAVQQNQFYVGFSTINSANPGSRLYDFELIKQDLLNNFNTRRGERVMNPEFGSNVWDLLMEPLTDNTAQMIQDEIVNICNSDPRISPTQIKITEYSSGYLLELTLTINSTNQSQSLTLAFDQALGLVVQQ